MNPYVVRSPDAVMFQMEHKISIASESLHRQPEETTKHYKSTIKWIYMCTSCSWFWGFLWRTSPNKVHFYSESLWITSMKRTCLKWTMIHRLEWIRWSDLADSIMQFLSQYINIDYQWIVTSFFIDVSYRLKYLTVYCAQVSNFMVFYNDSFICPFFGDNM